MERIIPIYDRLNNLESLRITEDGVYVKYKPYSQFQLFNVDRLNNWLSTNSYSYRSVVNFKLEETQDDPVYEIVLSNVSMNDLFAQEEYIKDIIYQLKRLSPFSLPNVDQIFKDDSLQSSSQHLNIESYHYDTENRILTLIVDDESAFVKFGVREYYSHFTALPVFERDIVLIRRLPCVSDDQMNLTLFEFEVKPNEEVEKALTENIDNYLLHLLPRTFA